MNQVAGFFKTGRVSLLLIAGLSLIVGVSGSASVFAQVEDHNITVLSSSVVSEFPEGMRFFVEVESEKEIEEISVRMKVGQNENSVYEYFEFDQADLVESELFWRTGVRGKYIPPGTIVKYHFEIRDVEGNEFSTEPVDFIYYDARFEWEEVEEGPVAVAYHGPVRRRAEIILEASIDTLDFMGPLLGAIPLSRSGLPCTTM